MRVEAALRGLSRTAAPEALVLAGLFLLAGMDVARVRLSAAAQAAGAQVAALDQTAADLADTLEDVKTLRDLKTKDLGSFKAGLSQLTASRRSLYEAGLELQDEKRQSEKLWEILTTYLLVDEAAKTVSVMTGEQALVSYPIGYAPARGFGGESRPATKLSRITSKERFAHPERGGFQEVGGKLQWEPPQVGTSVRANALGEYVVFTDGPLILHGPPNRASEHELFAHDCLGLSLAVARRLYEKTFIGTKILFKAAAAKPLR